MTVEVTQRREAPLLPHFLVVVVSRRGVVLPSLDRECSLADLMVLERLASEDPPPLEDVLDDIGRQGLGDLEALRDLVERVAVVAANAAPARVLDGRTLRLGASSSARDHDDSRSTTAVSRAGSGLFVLPTPLVLGLGRRGFEVRDHDDEVAVQLSARELVASTFFRDPTTVERAFEHQQAVFGSAALDVQEFDALVARLRSVSLLRPFDPADYAFRHGPNRLHEKVRRERKGRRSVAAAIARRMAALDEIEQERRARLGVARPKVIPVHGIKAAWRNPPLSLGLIFSYAMAYKGGLLQEHYDFRPDWVVDHDAIDRYSVEPAVYLFSSYIWNSSENLELSARVKERSPHSITIHGGPDVPKYEGDVATYFRAHPHVDILARGEGEVTAAEVLEALAGRIGEGPVDLSVLADVPGISYRNGDIIVRTADRPRLTDLNVIPSPYLEGLFDGYVEGWLRIADALGGGTDAFAFEVPTVVLETNRGCPYGCTFCDWGASTLSRIRQYDLDRVFAELDWCARNGVDSIGLADANFGIFARDVDITRKVAELKQTTGHPKQFGTNYAKNTVKHLRQIVQTLADVDILSFGLLSLQSMDADTLKVIERSNIKLEKYDELAREFRRAKLPLYIDLMLGLPGQTPVAFANDLQECIDREVHAKIFPTVLLANSPMNEPGYRERHGIVAKPGDFVTEAASFSRAEYDEMMRLRSLFIVVEKFGVLRHVARYVRQETGMREIDFFKGLSSAVAAAPGRYPILEFVLENMYRYMVPPVSWRRLLEEVAEHLVDDLGIPDDDALRTVVTVQLALLPSRGRSFPCTVELPHDYAAWYDAVVETKHDGHLRDWPQLVPPLRSFGPGVLTVDDPRGVCEYELGWGAEYSPLGAWELESPVSRAVAVA